MHLDDFTTAALALLAAAGKADFEVEAQLTRRRNSSYQYWLTTWDPSAERNPLDCHDAMLWGASADEVLGALATRLGTVYPPLPVEYITQQQRERLISLYNHPFASRAEKTKMQLNLSHYTYADAEQMLADGVGSFRQELRRREAASRGLTITAEVFTVAPAQAA